MPEDLSLTPPAIPAEALPPRNIDVALPISGLELLNDTEAEALVSLVAENPQIRHISVGLRGGLRNLLIYILNLDERFLSKAAYVAWHGDGALSEIPFLFEGELVTRLIAEIQRKAKQWKEQALQKSVILHGGPGSNLERLSSSIGHVIQETEVTGIIAEETRKDYGRVLSVTLFFEGGKSTKFVSNETNILTDIASAISAFRNSKREKKEE